MLKRVTDNIQEHRPCVNHDPLVAQLTGVTGSAADQAADGASEEEDLEAEIARLEAEVNCEMADLEVRSTAVTDKLSQRLDKSKERIVAVEKQAALVEQIGHWIDDSHTRTNQMVTTDHSNKKDSA